MGIGRKIRASFSRCIRGAPSNKEVAEGLEEQRSVQEMREAKEALEREVSGLSVQLAKAKEEAEECIRTTKKHEALMSALVAKKTLFEAEVERWKNLYNEANAAASKATTKAGEEKKAREAAEAKIAALQEQLSTAREEAWGANAGGRVENPLHATAVEIAAMMDRTEVELKEKECNVMAQIADVWKNHLTVTGALNRLTPGNIT